MKEKNTPKGIIKYRMPNIAEGFDFLSMIETMHTGADLFRVKGKFIEHMRPLIDFTGTEYKTWDEVLMDRENMFHPLSDIAQEIFDDITGVLVKKI